MLTEREYWNAHASEERAGKLAAEACNELLTPAEADFLMACVEQDVEDWTYLVEKAFDNAGWPDDDLSELWLDKNGMVIWGIYRAYRALGTKAAA